MQIQFHCRDIIKKGMLNGCFSSLVVKKQLSLILTYITSLINLFYKGYEMLTVVKSLRDNFFA